MVTKKEVSFQGVGIVRRSCLKQKVLGVEKTFTFSDLDCINKIHRNIRSTVRNCISEVCILLQSL